MLPIRQRGPNRVFDGEQILSCGIPHQLKPNAVVLVNQDIAEDCEIAPGDLRLCKFNVGFRHRSTSPITSKRRMTPPGRILPLADKLKVVLQGQQEKPLQSLIAHA